MGYAQYGDELYSLWKGTFFVYCYMESKSNMATNRRCYKIPLKAKLILKSLDTFVESNAMTSANQTARPIKGGCQVTHSSVTTESLHFDRLLVKSSKRCGENMHNIACVQTSPIERFHSRDQRPCFVKQKKMFPKKIEFNSRRIGLVHQTPPFICFGTTIWPPWHHMKTLCFLYFTWKARK